MSGPVGAVDVPADPGPTRPSHRSLELSEDRATTDGGMPVRRALPKRARRTVGGWCLADHFGPSDAMLAAMQIGPHPHIGLQTVTWLVEGEVLHRDSLGHEQLIRPGQLNLVTAGRGIAHAEETPASYRGRLHGLQLWVALPDRSRSGDPAFEHHSDLPSAGIGPIAATVLMGEFAGARSPARADTPLVGVDLAVGGAGTLPLDPAFEYGLLVLRGEVGIEGDVVGPGVLAYLGQGREALAVSGAQPARAILLGGVPWAGPILMWWNFVARTTHEIDGAVRDWDAGSERFGHVASPLAAIAAPRPHWATARPLGGAPTAAPTAAPTGAATVTIQPVPASATLALRQRVLRPHQTVDEVAFPGDDDVDSGHYAALDGREVVGVVSVRRQPPPWGSGGRPSWQLRGMATAEGRRNQGIGAALLAAVVEHVRSRGGGLLWCNARTPALSFYQRGGFATHGESWVDPVIGPHVAMERQVEPSLD